MNTLKKCIWTQWYASSVLNLQWRSAFRLVRNIQRALRPSQSTNRNVALSYTVSCPLSIIMKGAGTYKVFKIPKLILRSVLILMLGCEKHWHPLKHRTDKVRTPTSFSPPPQGQDTSHILLSKKLQIQLASLILVTAPLERGAGKRAVEIVFPSCRKPKCFNKILQTRWNNQELIL